MPNPFEALGSEPKDEPKSQVIIVILNLIIFTMDNGYNGYNFHY